MLQWFVTQRDRHTVSLHKKLTSETWTTMASMAFDEKATVNAIEVPIYVMSFFSPAIFKTLALLLAFSNLTMMHLDVDLLLHPM